MRILLVIPPSTYLIDDRVFPFLGPLQIAAVARERGHDVRVLDLTGHARRCDRPRHRDDCMAEETARAVADVIHAAHDADLVGCYALVAQYPVVRKFAQALRYDGFDRALVLGGPHANTVTSPGYEAEYEKVLADGWSHVVHADQGGGGGEDGFVWLLEHAADAPKIIRVPSRPPGVAHPNDRWPYPARDLIDLPSYRYAIDGERATSIIDQAGCAYACSFCSHWGDYRKMVARSIPHVVGEIREIKQRYGIRALMNYADEVNLRPDFDDYLEALGREDVIWRGFFKSGRKWMRDDLFARMRRAGCVELCTGAESLDEDVLRRVGKGSTVQDNLDFVRMCKRNGIRPKMFLQVGLPSESRESIATTKRRAIELAAEVGPFDLDFTITMPYFGAPVWEHPEKFDLAYDKRELDFGGEHPVFYKAQPGVYQAWASTSKLTRAEIVAMRDEMEHDVRAAMGLPLLMPEEAEGSRAV